MGVEAGDGAAESGGGGGQRRGHGAVGRQHRQQQANPAAGARQRLADEPIGGVVDVRPA